MKRYIIQSVDRIQNHLQRLPGPNEVSLACYRRQDWKRFLLMSDDKEHEYKYWYQWYKFYCCVKEELMNRGISIRVVLVDLDELHDYCIRKQVRNEAFTRANFVISTEYHRRTRVVEYC